jgi:hypothetical protein
LVFLVLAYPTMCVLDLGFEFGATGVSADSWSAHNASAIRRVKTERKEGEEEGEEKGEERGRRDGQSSRPPF